MTSEEMADDETKEKIQEIAKSKITGKNYKMMFSDRKVQEIFCTFE